MSDLARRAVACRHWRWLPGMRAIGGCVVATGCPLWLVDGVPRMPVDGEHYMWLRRTTEHPDVLPDLTDPATLGCLLALVRKAWGDPLMQTTNSGGGWVAFCPAPLWTDGPYDTEAAALVAALEAAP